MFQKTTIVSIVRLFLTKNHSHDFAVVTRLTGIYSQTLWHHQELFQDRRVEDGYNQLITISKWWWPATFSIMSCFFYTKLVCSKAIHHHLTSQFSLNSSSMWFPKVLEWTQVKYVPASKSPRWFFVEKWRNLSKTCSLCCALLCSKTSHKKAS